MLPAVFEDVIRYLGQKTDDPEIRAKRKHMAKLMFADLLDLDEAPASLLAGQVELRLARPLTSDEHAAIREGIHRVGVDRLGRLVITLSPEALAAWLADPTAQ